jgi:ribosome biogenesis GTPase
VAKKKKVRVEFRKNRQKRTRANDLTRQFQKGAEPAVDAASSERVRAKGDLSRRRTIITQETEGPSPSGAGASGDEAPQLAVDLSECLLGRVVRSHGLESVVETDDGRAHRCGVRRLLRTLAIDARHVVAVGDRVWFRPGGDGQGLIERVEPRSGSLTRGYRGREQVLVSNVDQLLIVSAFAEPTLKLALIDRYLISAEKGGVRPVIVLNKADLVDPAPYQWVLGMYSQLGYETVPISVETGLGLDRIRALLAGRSTAVSGQSGVGKSSLLNAIQPGLKLRVGTVSSASSKGRHTTTNAELVRLDNGGYVVDTPGLRQFELWDVHPRELDGHFIEFRAYAELCRFPDCSHTHEGGCAVKDAVHFGQIHAARFESYRRLHEGQPIEE